MTPFFSVTLNISGISFLVKPQGIQCIQVINMQKKTAYISLRTDEETKEYLEKYAAGKKWSLSLLVEDILQEWIKQRQENETPKD